MLARFSPSVFALALSVPVCCASSVASAKPKTVRANQKVTRGVTGWTSGSQTYLRARPGTGVPPVAKVGKHTKLFVWGKYNGWYRVETSDGKFGWVFNQYLNAKKPHKVAKLTHKRAKQASDRTDEQTMYGSRALLKRHYARYGAPGAAKSLGLRVRTVRRPAPRIAPASPDAQLAAYKPSARLNKRLATARTASVPRQKPAYKPSQVAATRPLAPRLATATRSKPALAAATRVAVAPRRADASRPTASRPTTSHLTASRPTVPRPTVPRPNVSRMANAPKPTLKPRLGRVSRSTARRLAPRLARRDTSPRAPLSVFSAPATATGLRPSAPRFSDAPPAPVAPMPPAQITPYASAPTIAPAPTSQQLEQVASANSPSLLVQPSAPSQSLRTQNPSPSVNIPPSNVAPPSAASSRAMSPQREIPSAMAPQREMPATVAPQNAAPSGDDVPDTLPAPAPDEPSRSLIVPTLPVAPEPAPSSRIVPAPPLVAPRAPRLAPVSPRVTPSASRRSPLAMRPLPVAPRRAPLAPRVPSASSAPSTSKATISERRAIINAPLGGSTLAPSSPFAMLPSSRPPMSGAPALVVKSLAPKMTAAQKRWHARRQAALWRAKKRAERRAWRLKVAQKRREVAQQRRVLAAQRVAAKRDALRQRMGAPVMMRPPMSSPQLAPISPAELLRAQQEWAVSQNGATNQPLSPSLPATEGVFAPDAPSSRPDRPSDPNPVTPSS